MIVVGGYVNIKQYIAQFFLIGLLFDIQLVGQPRLLLVEGNIGVGKTTFLQLLSSSLIDSIVISEPCDEWQNIQGHNLLDAFYKDNNRWACTMQLYVLMTTVRKLQRSIVPSCNLYIMERSLYTSKYCFSKILSLMGSINDLEWSLYLDVWNWYVKQTLQPFAIIYLRAEPEICYDRMKARARTEEGVVPLEYLKMLHDRHDEWLLLKKYHNDMDIPVLVLDASCNFRDDTVVQQRFIRQILDFLQNQENTIFTI